MFIFLFRSITDHSVFEYEICYAYVRCIVKRAGMRPTRVSVKIVSFNLGFVVIEFYPSVYFQFYGISSSKESEKLDAWSFCL